MKDEDVSHLSSLVIAVGGGWLMQEKGSSQVARFNRGAEEEARRGDQGGRMRLKI